MVHRLDKNQTHPQTLAMIKTHHNQAPIPNQCASCLVQTIDASLPLVWSIIRNFSKPQAYQRFIKDCTMLVVRNDNGHPGGSVRKIDFVSGLPLMTSTEKLGRLDDDLHVMEISIVGGDHRLVNYKSVITLHQIEEAAKGQKSTSTVVVESYVVDVPKDSCREDTCFVVDTVIGFNHKSLATISEKMARS